MKYVIIHNSRWAILAATVTWGKPFLQRILGTKMVQKPKMILRGLVLDHLVWQSELIEVVLKGQTN